MLLKKFLTVALIVYAILNLVITFIDSTDLFSIARVVETGTLMLVVVFLVLAAINSILLLIGAWKSKANLLICCLILFSIRFVMFSINFNLIYDFTLGCEEFCADDKEFVFYSVIAIQGKSRFILDLLLN